MKSMCHDVRRNSPSVIAMQADVLLQLDGVGDGGILDGAQRVGVDAAGGELVARGEQLGRAQQAADVVGPEGRGGAEGHSGSVVGEGCVSDAADLDQVGDHHVVAAELQVVGVGDLLDALDLRLVGREQRPEREEREVDDARASGPRARAAARSRPGPTIESCMTSARPSSVEQLRQPAEEVVELVAAPVVERAVAARLLVRIDRHLEEARDDQVVALVGRPLVEVDVRRRSPGRRRRCGTRSRRCSRSRCGRCRSRARASAPLSASCTVWMPAAAADVEAAHAVALARAEEVLPDEEAAVRRHEHARPRSRAAAAAAG